MKNKKLLHIVIISLALLFLVRIAWISMASVSEKINATSPDKRHVAKVLSRYCTGFLGSSHDRHVIVLESAGGRVCRKIDLDEESKSWPQNCSIDWAKDGSSVTFVFEREDLEQSRLVLMVGR